MFQGAQGNINNSTAGSGTEASFFDSFDMENPKNVQNPLMKMPMGHAGYTEADKDKCPVMSGKIKPPVEEIQDEEEDSDSSDEEEENQALMPEGHGSYTEADKEKCPVMSGKVALPQSQQVQKKKKKKIQSGCPFMPSENKKNPALAHLEPSYEIPYLSTVRHLFSFKGFTPGMKNKNTAPNRAMFDTYPIFLKHTLFHDEEKFGQVRKMELSQRFFVYDNFREQGNKKYNRGRYTEALALYEHALSCFRWLQVKKEEEKKQDEDDEEFKEDPYAKLKPLNRALATVLTDDNVELFDGQEYTDSHDIDMRNSMLLSIYLAIACCYLQLNHYTAAVSALEEGIKLTGANSQLYFRRSQARAFNKGATLEDLNKAKEDIEKAIEVRHTEKLFQQEAGLLRIMNVHNAGEIYVEHAHLVDKLIKEKNEEIKTGIKPFFSRVKELEYIEEAIANEGSQVEDKEEHAVEIHHEEEPLEEMELIREIMNKYFKIIEFNIETGKKDQVTIARKELQNVLELYTRMKMYFNMDFKNYENNPIITDLARDFEIDLSKPKNQKRFEKLKLSKAKDIFESAHFNVQVFQYAVKDHLKKKQEKEERKVKAQNRFKDAEKPKKWSITIFGVEIGLHIFLMFALFALFWYGAKNGLLSTVFSKRN